MICRSACNKRPRTSGQGQSAPFLLAHFEVVAAAHVSPHHGPARVDTRLQCILHRGCQPLTTQGATQRHPLRVNCSTALQQLNCNVVLDSAATQHQHQLLLQLLGCLAASTQKPAPTQHAVHKGTCAPGLQATDMQRGNAKCTTEEVSHAAHAATLRCNEPRHQICPQSLHATDTLPLDAHSESTLTVGQLQPQGHV